VGQYYIPSTANVGTSYYYVGVTNTNTAVNGAQTAKVVSNVAAVTVHAVVNAETPTIGVQPEGAAYSLNDSAMAMTVSAFVSDGGSLSYQWFANTTGSTSGGIPVGAGASYIPLTGTVGTTYYYVVVTNTNTRINGIQTAAITSGTAAVTVNAPVVENVIIIPSAVSVQQGQTQQFSAMVNGLYNPPQNVYWTVSGNTSAGTYIDESGLLSVDANETPETELTVTATSALDTGIQGMATVTTTVQPIHPAVLSVTVSPATASVQKGDSLQFAAFVDTQGGATSEVAWSVNSVCGSTIDGNGLLIVAVGETAMTLLVTATSNYDNAKADTVIVTITNPPAPPLITTIPILPNGTVGLAYQLYLTAYGETPLLWSIDSGNLPDGISLSTDGLLSGIPTGCGTLHFTVRVSNSVDSVTLEMSITVLAVQYGDVNGDGMVDLRDATLIMQYYTKLVDLSELAISVADVNGDGIIDLRDATLIMQYYTKLIDHLGPES